MPRPPRNISLNNPEQFGRLVRAARGPLSLREAGRVIGVAAPSLLALEEGRVRALRRRAFWGLVDLAHEDGDRRIARQGKRLEEMTAARRTDPDVRRNIARVTWGKMPTGGGLLVNVMASAWLAHVRTLPERDSLRRTTLTRVHRAERKGVKASWLYALPSRATARKYRDAEEH